MKTVIEAREEEYDVLIRTARNGTRSGKIWRENMYETEENQGNIHYESTYSRPYWSI